MPNPSMGAKIPGMDKSQGPSWASGSGSGVAGGSGMAQNIMNSLNNTSPPAATSPPMTPPTWSGGVTPSMDPTQISANPNYGYQSMPRGVSGSPDPNAPSTPGVPIDNNPSINSQGAPGFGLNSMYSMTPSNTNLLASIGSAGARM